MSPESPIRPHSVQVTLRVISNVGEGKSLLDLLRRRHPGPPGFIRNRSRDDTPVYFVDVNPLKIDQGTNPPIAVTPIQTLILLRVSVIVLVVSAEMGPTPEILLQLRLIRLLGIDAILTVITRSEGVSESQLDQTIYRTRMALSNEGYPADDMPILFASLRPDPLTSDDNEEQNRLLDEIMEELDRLSSPYAHRLEPLFVRIEEVSSLPPYGVAIRGRVEQGKEIPEQTVEIMGGKHQENRVLAKLSGKLKDLQMDYDGFFLLTPPTNPSDVEPGMFLSTPGSVLIAKQFRWVGCFRDPTNYSKDRDFVPIEITITIRGTTYDAFLVITEEYGDEHIGFFQIGNVTLEEKIPMQVGWPVDIFSRCMGRIIEILSD